MSKPCCRRRAGARAAPPARRARKHPPKQAIEPEAESRPEQEPRRFVWLTHGQPGTTTPAKPGLRTPSGRLSRARACRPAQKPSASRREGERSGGFEIGGRDGRRSVQRPTIPAGSRRGAACFCGDARCCPARHRRSFLAESAGRGAAESRVLGGAERAASGLQLINSDRRETLHRETARDVLDMRVEAAVLVDDDHRREPAALPRFREMAF